MQSEIEGDRIVKASVIATFQSEADARAAAEQLRAGGLPPDKVAVKPRSGERAVEYAQMRDELDGFAGSPGIGAGMSKSMVKGSVMGTAVFTAIGVILGLGLGYLWGGTPFRLLVGALSLGFAGATFGFTVGGFLKPRLRPDEKDKGEFEDEPVAQPLGPSGDSSGQFVVEVAGEDEQELARAVSALEKMSPERLDRFNASGQVTATREAPPGRSDSEGARPG